VNILSLFCVPKVGNVGTSLNVRKAALCAWGATRDSSETHETVFPTVQISCPINVVLLMLHLGKVGSKRKNRINLADGLIY